MLTLYAQDLNAVYIVVNTENIGKDNCSKDVFRSTYFNADSYKDTVHIFKLYVNANDHMVVRFSHHWMLNPRPFKNLYPSDQHQCYYKDREFLKSVNVLFWDDIKRLERMEAKSLLYDEIYNSTDNSRYKIYIIDMAEKYHDDMIKLYEVVISGDLDRPYMHGEKPDWSEHMKLIKAKINEKQKERMQKIIE